MGLFTNILNTDTAPTRGESLEWFRESVSEMTRGQFRKPSRILKEGQSVPNAILGSMYMFMYDAKYGDVMPYFDRFPLVIPFDFTDNGFYGINLHYIAPKFRVLLLEELYSMVTDDDLAEDAKFKLSYELIQSITGLRYAKPCIKRYLTTHIKGQVRLVNPSHWSVVSMLPTAQFKKFNVNTVYADSRKQF